MPIARGRITLVAALLAIVLAAVACSKAESPEGSAARENPPPAPQATPAAAEPAERADPATKAEDGAPLAPEFLPQNAAGAVLGEPAPTNTVPIVAVANYFTELPGIDIAGLKRGQREKFLQRINSEICACGCKNDTLAHCHVNDPNCPIVKGIIQKLYDEAKSGK